MTFMGELLSGSAPLRGRAGLDLTVLTFDHQAAAVFWEIDDPHLAVRVHSIVGGTPAYRREYTAGDAPAGADDFDAWVVRTVLNPASPLFKEARYLLAEEPSLRDRALYQLGPGRRCRGEPHAWRHRPLRRPAGRRAATPTDRAGGRRPVTSGPGCLPGQP